MKREKTIKVLKIEPKQKPYIKEIEDSLNELQKELVGLIQIFNIDKDAIIICNDEGKLDDLKANRRIENDIICGNSKIGKITSLTNEQIEKYSDKFKEIELFTGQEKELEPRIEIIGFDYNKGF